MKRIWNEKHNRWVPRYSFEESQVLRATRASNTRNRWHGKRYTLQEMFCAGIIGANVSVACCVLILEFAGLL